MSADLASRDVGAESYTSPVPVVVLRAPLKDLAGGGSERRVDEPSVLAVLRALEERYPKVRGWILDEQGALRRHVNVFVNGDMTRGDDPVGANDRIHVLPSITGGSDR